MNSLRLLNGLVVLAGILVAAGCSTTKTKPVYADVPGQSEVSVELGATTTQPIAATQIRTTSAASSQPKRASEPKPQVIVTPDESMEGKIVSVNDVGRFVVLRFPLGKIPALDSTLYVYRQGMKVAELKVTGPQKDDHIVADIRSGTCQPEDEVRDR